ncbi:MAG: hydrogenase expression/formation protein HypE [Gammaproteobacteria bacterium]|jgi:hydrogenase expression/formation protein HypE|nr:hydrogenase expression/formation protein HypE [Gammaproteobacteria bacterium]
MDQGTELRIELAHGNGGRLMRELIESVFARHLGNDLLDVTSDSARVPIPAGQDVFVTTDGFIVNPLEFPGGDIGSLAVHGTVNDLSVAGATPLYLTLNAFIEEGLEIARLDRLVSSLARAAKGCGVRVVAGDTKVVVRGEGGGLYLATTGIGVREPGRSLGLDQVREGDVLLVSGPVGDHGTAVMLAREEFGLRGDVRSDSASVFPLAQALLPFAGLRFMRDPTRGGLASVANELVRASGMGVRLAEARVPVREPVRSVCEMLGYDPYYLACEGRLVAVVEAGQAEAALAALRGAPGGEHAQSIGEITARPACVVLETELGGERILEELEDDPLPRIC